MIAAINGPCAGMGMPLALCCDLRFASEKAIFTTAFARRGLIAEWGLSWLLPLVVGALPRLRSDPFGSALPTPRKRRTWAW